MKRVLITGGAGFIAHHLIFYLLNKTNWEIVSIDRLDYSGNLNRLNHIMSELSETERQNITLTLLSPLGNPFPLSEQAISDFMNLSKVFTLFSDKEGESRVVSEALLCGLPVVVKKDILGGATDYLNIQNSKLFTSLGNVRLWSASTKS